MSTALTEPPTVLVIDDEASIREGCRQSLEAEGFRAGVATDGRSGLRLMTAIRPRVVLVDLKMPGLSGMDVLTNIRKRDPTVACVVITGYGTVQSAVEAMRIGASDYLQKPFTPDELVGAVRRVLDTRKDRRETVIQPSIPIGDEVFVIKLILRKAARDMRFGRKLLYEGPQELHGWALSPEARAAIISGDEAWLTRRCAGLSDEERAWLEARPW